MTFTAFLTGIGCVVGGVGFAWLGLCLVAAAVSGMLFDQSDSRTSKAAGLGLLTIFIYMCVLAVKFCWDTVASTFLG